jgi:hypothetical protein
MFTITPLKRGRKPVPKNKQRKNMTISLSQETIGKLTQDAEEGKAESSNKMATKIIDKYYKMIEKKEKNKQKKENIIDKKDNKNNENFIFS